MGNLASQVTDKDLQPAFSEYEQITSAKTISKRFSGRSRGFGFVEMPNDPDAGAAVDGMNGKDLKGHVLNVKEARPRGDRGEGGRFERN